jgi:hypothetical protein
MLKESRPTCKDSTIPLVVGGFALQMVFIESWSCAKTPVAPNSSVARPTTVARTPPPCCWCMLATIPCTAAAPAAPTRSASCV